MRAQRAKLMCKATHCAIDRSNAHALREFCAFQRKTEELAPWFFYACLLTPLEREISHDFRHRSMPWQPFCPCRLPQLHLRWQPCEGLSAAVAFTMDANGVCTAGLWAAHASLVEHVEHMEHLEAHICEACGVVSCQVTRRKGWGAELNAAMTCIWHWQTASGVAR